MDIVFLCIYFLILALIVTLSFRNRSVAVYRRKILSKIDVAGRDDILSGRDWFWRFQYFDTVSYDDMMCQFWRPLDSFYADSAFITVGAHGLTKV